MRERLKGCAELQTVLRTTARISGYLWDRGWAERNAGNLSVDVSDLLPASFQDEEIGSVVDLELACPDLTGRCYLVTGTGCRYREIADEALSGTCILQILEGGERCRMFWGGDGGPVSRPTSEFPSHLRIHEFLRQSKAPELAVLHTHPTELISLSHLPDLREERLLNRALWGIHPEVKIMLPPGVGLVPYTVPGSEDLAQKTVAVFRRGFSVALWQFHGCVAIGTDLSIAFDLIDIVNKAATMILHCRKAGYVPEGLSAENLQELVRRFDLDE